MIDAAVETILPAASAKDIGVHVTIDPASRSMVGDATRLQQAVWNLLSNAVKFTAPGGRVDVETRADNGQIELTVTDSGVGIDAAFLPFVFDRFRQADVSNTRTHAGLGLGLAIVRHLVELHVMLAALRGFGASVWCATSATEAIRKLPECRPDLVLSDIAMPGRDGYALLSEIRQVETALGRRIPVAAVSAYAHAEDHQRAITAGFDQFMAKPVDFAVLASTVKALVAIGNRQLA